jgi:hypothetical protein
VEDNSVWLRQVQLRLLNRKDRSAASLSGLDALLFNAFYNIHLFANKLIVAQNVVDYFLHC